MSRPIPQTSDPEGAPGVSAPVEPPDTSGPEANEQTPLLSNQTKFGKAFYARMSEREFPSDAARIEYVVETIGRFVESTKEITEAEASLVMARLDEESVVDAEVVA